MVLKKKKIGVSNVVIDEAQDFSVFQLHALKHVLDTRRFTILGDLSQGIFAYRGIKDWADVAREVFAGDCGYLTLEQSYRTTIEIMNLANKVITKWDHPGMVKARPVIRHGEPPRLIKCSSPGEMAESVLPHLDELRDKGYRTVAFICKTVTECDRLKKHLQGKIPAIQTLTGKEDVYRGGIIILPAYLAKGLEFDAVFVASPWEGYTLDELNIKLLYVAMTRAQHRLYIIQVGKNNPLPNGIETSS